MSYLPCETQTKMDIIDFENLPEYGLRHIRYGDFRAAGQFVVQSRSGFFLCTAGQMEFADRERFYNIKRGDIYLYSSNNQLYIKETGEDLEGYAGIADMTYILSMASSLLKVDRVTKSFTLAHPCISLTDGEMKDIEELCELFLRKDAMEHSGIQRQICNHIGKALCFQIALAFSRHEENRIKPSSREDQIVLKFLFSLQKYIYAHHDVVFYAGLQSLSTRYFSAVIKARTGHTAIEWIIDVVIAASKNLLSDPAMSIKEVGYRMGFPNPSFFGRYFRHYTGMSPGEYREAVARQRMGSSD